MSEEVSQLVSAAVSGAEQGQTAFADKLPLVLKSFSAAQVRDQFLPFLISWLPSNNRAAVLKVAEHVLAISESAGGLKPVAPLIELVIAGDDPRVSEKVAQDLQKFKADAMVDELVKVLVESRFDSVRRFTAQIVLLSPKDSFIEQTCETLSRDKAFIVRDSVGHILRSLKTDIAAKLVPTLVKDPHSRIRGFLACDLAQEPFFFDLVAGPLATDSDWSVRAALATSLGKTKDLAKAASLCERLSKDGVWQVVLCALRSLTQILTANKDFAFALESPDELLRLIRCDRNPLKLVVIDCFFAQHNLEAASVSQLLTAVTREPSVVKLHFLEEITKHKEFASVVSEHVTRLVYELSGEQAWRVRLGVVQVLKGLADVLGQPGVANDFKDLCVRMLDDEAFLVKKAAIQHLSDVYLREGDEIPSLVGVLKKDNSFRKRQAAIGILQFMKEGTQSEALKQKIDAELKELANDPINNVAYVAKEVLHE